MKDKVSTSMRVFRSHIIRSPQIDVTGVFSPQCYWDWLELRSALACDAQAKIYVRILCNHVTGVDGRAPFDEEEEAALLAYLRKREPWPCFPPHLGHLVRGFRAKGYHEKQELAKHPYRAAVVHGPQTEVPVAPLAPPSRVTPVATAEDAMEQIKSMLPSADAEYLQNFGESVMRNYCTPDFSMEHWKSINVILRYMVLARTNGLCGSENRCAKDTLQEAARGLVERFSLTPTTLVFVSDPAAKHYHERVLMQNDYASDMFGLVKEKTNTYVVVKEEMLGIVLALGGAVAQPGRFFPVFNQQNRCSDGVVRAFDVYYYCDPESMLLVFFGKLCSV